MLISDVQAWPLSSPINPPQKRSFHGGTRALHKRDIVLVAIDTADGQRGYATVGASSSSLREHFDDKTQSTTANILEGPVAGVLEGETIDAISDAHELMADLDLSVKLASEVVSGIDIALYDIKGKRQGTPIYELLNDSNPTTELPLYASAGMYMPPSGYAKQAETLAELGFFGYKYRPGIGPEDDQETIERLRDAVEDRCELMIDAHTWWKLGDAYDKEAIDELLAAYEAADAYWLEEPVAPDDYSGYQEMSKWTAVPLAGGESEPSPKGLIDLAEIDAVSFLQGDVRHHAGFTGCWRAIKYCAGNDVQFVPHHFGTWLGLIANSHLVAAAPETNLLEYPVFTNDPALASTDDPGMYPFDLAFDILDDKPDIQDGRLQVPDGPGLGVSVNEGVIEEYPFQEGAWTTFEYDSGT